MYNYSIVEAKNNLSRIVHEAEEGETINLTRRGELVAVLLSAEAFQKITKKQASPASALEDFLGNENYKKVDIDQSIFEDLRVKTSGRDIQL